MASIKDERYLVVEAIGADGGQNCVILTSPDIGDNSLFVIDGRNCRLVKSEASSSLVLQKDEKMDDFNSTEHGMDGGSKGVVPIEKILTCYPPLSILQLSCPVCQNACLNCKHVCVTCRAPCRNCLSACQSSYTDTDDFDKYLESLTRKVKLQPKIKTIGTDTCDLESHFDYYKDERKEKKIQKSVGTDCRDLRIVMVEKKPRNKTVCVDTNDLYASDEPSESSPVDLFYEPFWNIPHSEELKTYGKKAKTDSIEHNSELDFKKEGPFVEDEAMGEDSESGDHGNDYWSEGEPAKDENEKENADKVPEVNIKKTRRKVRKIVFDETSTSDDSDVDLSTSSKLIRIRQTAKYHKLSLNEVKNGKSLSYECDICNESFRKKYLGVLHLDKHILDDQYKCLTCGNKFVALSLLSRHAKQHAGVGMVNEPEKNIKCDVCHKRFDSKSKMLKHRSFHKKDSSFECTLCQPAKTFSSYKPLYVHKRLKHGVIAKQEDMPARKPRLKREFVCLFCGKEFKSNKALTDHIPVHTGEKNYPCDICNKSYTTSANLHIHKRTHTGLKSFKCTVCDKAFHKKDSLKVHLRKHSGERPFECDLCPMKFDRNYILKNHRLRHFAEKTYICPVCGKAFTTHGGLNNHEKSHKRDPEMKRPRKPAVKPTLDTQNAVICDVCGKVYSTKSNLRIHKFVHLGIKPFQCPVCNQTYAKKDSMRTHMRKHTEERPFACDVCGMTFYRNHTLKTHHLRHTGERPHKCSMCGKSFTQSSSLAYHIKHHDRPDKKKIQVSDEKRKRFPSRMNLKRVIRDEPLLKKETEGIVLVKREDFDLHEKDQLTFVKDGHHFMVPLTEKDISEKVLILDRNDCLTG